MLCWENDVDNWQVSNTEEPFTKDQMDVFVCQDQSLIENKQQRFMICLKDKPIGCVDLFEYSKRENSAGVGILIAEKMSRNSGCATAALKLLILKCSNELKIVHLFCNIFKENKASIRLFEKCGFQFVEERLLEGEQVNYYELNL